VRATDAAAPLTPARTGVWIAIATISMSFAAYTSALLVRQGTASDWAQFRLPPILYLNSLVLLASSATIARARRRMAAGPVAGAARSFGSLGGRWLALTLGLGLLFVAGQLLAWRQLADAGLYLASNPGSSFFYVFTGLHALHLLGGMAALGYVLWRLWRTPAAPPVNAAGATALYWHFMDLLWLYLLLVLALRL
jgi:cytochrome c oxidase subunit III